MIETVIPIARSFGSLSTRCFWLSAPRSSTSCFHFGTGVFLIRSSAIHALLSDPCQFRLPLLTRRALSFFNLHCQQHPAIEASKKCEEHLDWYDVEDVYDVRVGEV